VDVTVNGLGERAGNAPLEEVVMAARLTLGYETSVKCVELAALCSLVAEISGLPLAPDKPITGTQAFLHESGIHVHALLANQRTYEPFDASEVGRARSAYVIGKHSGRANLRRFLAEHGWPVNHANMKNLLESVRRYSAKKKASLTESEVHALYDTIIRGET
jgi:homocitrate synthase NifV